MRVEAWTPAFAGVTVLGWRCRRISRRGALSRYVFQDEVFLERIPVRWNHFNVIAGPPGPAAGRPEDKLDPAIQGNPRPCVHSACTRPNLQSPAWIAGSSPAMTTRGAIQSQRDPP